MHLTLLPSPIAGLINFNLPELVAVLIPIAGIILAGVVVVCAMYFRHRRREMWHQTARLALEKGQPIPPQPAGEVRLQFRAERERNDVRAGLILIAVGAGIYLFLRTGGDSRLGIVGAIPGFIGVALLLNGLFASLSAKGKNPSDDRPPQS